MPKEALPFFSSEMNLINGLYYHVLRFLELFQELLYILKLLQSSG